MGALLLQRAWKKYAFSNIQLDKKGIYSKLLLIERRLSFLCETRHLRDKQNLTDFSLKLGLTVTCFPTPHQLL